MYTVSWPLIHSSISLFNAMFLLLGSIDRDEFDGAVECNSGDVAVVDVSEDPPIYMI
jgi:hypothetical protein